MREAVPLSDGDMLPPDASPLIWAAHGYWQAIRPEPEMLPGFRHVDAWVIGTQHPKLLPHLWVLDVLRDPWRFRYRLVGSAVVDAGATNRVGHHVHDFLSGPALKEIENRIVAVCNTGRPDYRKGTPILPQDRNLQELQRIFLPLAEDGRKIDKLLCCSVFSWQPGYDFMQKA